MMIFKLSSVVGLAAAAEWDYKTNGADWIEKCATGKRQSPIDLRTNWKTTVETQPWSRVYQDNIFDQVVEWDGHTSKMNFD